jgi:hypothetical protein
MSATANALVRAAFVTLWDAYTATGNVLEGVVVMPEPPVSYADLYGTSRGTLDMIWIDDSTTRTEPGANCADGVFYEENTTHTVVIQVDRQPDSWTQALVDARCDQLLEAVVGMAGGDPSLGVDYLAEGLATLKVTATGWEYRRRILDSGGTRPGHSAAYVVTFNAYSASKFTTPVLV